MKLQGGILGRRSGIVLILMFFPTLLSIIVYKILPSAVLVIAFKDLNNGSGLLRSDWVGLDNFRYLFSSSFPRILFNTVTYNFIFTLLTTSISLLVAFGLRQTGSRRMVSFLLTLFIIPSLLSWIMISYISRSLFDSNGLLNTLLLAADMEPVSWYTDATHWRLILVLFYLWKNVGFYILLFYSAMSGVKKEYIYASVMDGASRFAQFFEIYLPLIRKTISIIIVFSIADILISDFGLFYNLPKDSGLLYPVTDVIDTYMYRGLRSGDFGVSVAANFIQSIGGLLIVACVFMVRKRFDEKHS